MVCFAARTLENNRDQTIIIFTKYDEESKRSIPRESAIFCEHDDLV